MKIALYPMREIEHNTPYRRSFPIRILFLFGCRFAVAYINNTMEWNPRYRLLTRNVSVHVSTHGDITYPSS